MYKHSKHGRVRQAGGYNKCVTLSQSLLYMHSSQQTANHINLEEENCLAVMSILWDCAPLLALRMLRCFSRHVSTLKDLMPMPAHL